MRVLLDDFPAALDDFWRRISSGIGNEAAKCLSIILTGRIKRSVEMFTHIYYGFVVFDAA